MIFSHSGDIGDLVASLALVRHLGGGDIVLFPGPTREAMTPDRVEVLRPLLESQPYVHSVTYADAPSPDGINLDMWRRYYSQGLNLTDMNFAWMGKQHPHREEPWMHLDPLEVAEVVFVRSPRYHGSFPWQRARVKYADRSVMVGLRDEHLAFSREHGPISWYGQSDLLTLARVIAGAKLVLTNQTGLYWIAEALKRPVCLEAAAPHSGCRNCHWDRPCCVYAENQLAELPDIDQLDERLAHVYAGRDCGRSLLDKKKLTLARAAMACRGVAGDAIEMGVYRGGSAAILASCLPDRVVHLADTFSGIPADDSMEGGHRQGEFAASLDEVRRFLAGYRVEYHPGMVPDSLAGLEGPFSFAHVDMDTYQSTAAGLDYLLPRMSAGGTIVLDDLDWEMCPGVRRAADERGLVVEAAGNMGIVHIPR